MLQRRRYDAAVGGDPRRRFPPSFFTRRHFYAHIRSGEGRPTAGESAMSEDTSSFPMTDWSLIRRVAGDEEPAARRLDLNELLKRYMPPMRRFIRQRFRLNDDEAEDWLQGFITSKLLQSALLSRADQDHGKFRALLSRALADYGIDQFRRRRTRGPNGHGTDEQSPVEIAAPATSDPAVLFERHWAEHAIAEALRLTKERLCATNRAAAWEVFSRRLLEQGEAARSYQVLTNEFGFEKPSQAAIALNTAKRIFRRKLNDVLIEFGATHQDLGVALAELRNIFQN
ncbi:MAG: sigma-70 family RNA polymerase sigma factor [Anaerolineae bacterium]|nr:sigma-70 family RNA polymerase sigma factor [Phycisphaerae bacterium]